MSSKAFLALAGVALAGAIGFAPAAEASYVLTTSGTVSGGLDGSGVFGAAGANLGGSPYTLSVVFEPGPLSVTSDGASFTTLSGTTTAVVTVTVNGTSFSDVIKAANLTVSADHLAGPDLLLTLGGTAADGQFFNVYDEVNGSGFDFLPGAGLTPPESYLVQAGDFAAASFDTTGPSGIAGFQAAPGSIGLTSVPEPAAGFVLLGGLLGFGFLRRTSPQGRAS